MQIIKSLLKVAIFILPIAAFGQSTYLLPGAKEQHFIERLEIKQQLNTHLNFSTLKPYSRRFIVQETEMLDSARLGYPDSLGQDMYKDFTDLAPTDIDEYNIRSLLRNNSEWVTTARDDFESKRPLLGTFYKTKANMLEVNSPGFFLAVNPMIQFSYSFEKGNNERVFYNSRGISARGLIAKKVGFSTWLTDNQERAPLFVSSNNLDIFFNNQTVQGVGFNKEFKTTGRDFFDARGYITFNAAKFIDFQFGHDKNFIGNGHRSLFLSDFGNSYLFAKINTRIWKLNYQNLFMELMPQFIKTKDTLLDRKYAAMHHLSMNVTKWLNIGIFEGIVFGRKNRFDFQYLNPIIFYRHIEGSAGSPDNALMGLDFKANIAHAVQVYGQFLMDEFILKELKNNKTSWVNKFGIQAGIKYVDAFNIRNLDIQLETNRVRPFTYSHYDSVANYTHYNQPLAHPLGANFQEFLVKVQYQPTAKMYVNAFVTYYYKGIDSAGANFGGNIYKDYRTRLADNGFTIGSGNKATGINAIASLSYELKENLYIDATGQYRATKTLLNPAWNKTSMFTLGLRLNLARRTYDW